MFLSTLVGAVAPVLLASAQQIRTDPGVYGPALEIMHYYQGQWPTGVTVSSSGRMFSNFPPGLDGNNTNTGSNGKYTVAELTSMDGETPYPSAAWNSPPGGAINYTTSPPTSANYANHLIGVQSVVIDGMDRLWILDTGRVINPASGVMLNAAYGGPKLVGVDLGTNTVFRTILLPANIAFPDSYLNDVRFDLRPNLSNAGSAGVAYITDSSPQHSGLIIIDIASGESWRHLDNDPAAAIELQFVPFVWGQPYYGYMAGQPRSFIGFGADGIALSKDGSTLFFAPTSGNYMYSISTALLRLHGPKSEARAQAGVKSLTQKGVSDGFESDTNNYIYMGNNEQSAVIFWNPANASLATFVRDPRLSWVDTLSVAGNYLYFTDNQLTFSPQVWPGTERRIHPYVLFRAPLPHNGTKIILT